MIYKPSLINLYQKIDEDLFEKADISSVEIDLSYLNYGAIKTIETNDKDVLSISEIEPEWSPSHHNLNLELTFIVGKPNVLFGETGVTAKSNKIGIATLLYSRESNHQETIKIGSFEFKDEKYIAKVTKNFEAGSLRGQIFCEIFFYLEEVNEVLEFHAHSSGMILSNGSIFELQLNVDGDGSEFPIVEFEDKNAPLWIIEKNWVDSSEDIFDGNHVRLKLNKKHKDFRKVAINPTNNLIYKSYLKEIVIQAMISIVQEVLLIEQKDISEEPLVQNSILSMVKYWVDVYDIDTSSIISISNSLRTNLDEKLIGDQND